MFDNDHEYSEIAITTGKDGTKWMRRPLPRGSLDPGFFKVPKLLPDNDPFHTARWDELEEG